MQVDEQHASREPGDRICKLLLRARVLLLAPPALDQRPDVTLQDRAHPPGQGLLIGDAVAHLPLTASRRTRSRSRSRRSAAAATAAFRARRLPAVAESQYPRWLGAIGRGRCPVTLPGTAAPAPRPKAQRISPDPALRTRAIAENHDPVAIGMAGQALSKTSHLGKIAQADQRLQFRHDLVEAMPQSL